MKIKSISTGLLGGLVAIVFSVTPAFAATSIVNETTPGKPGTWTTPWTEFNRANGDVSVSSDYGAPADFGKGALKIVTTTDSTPTGDSKTTLFTSKYGNMPLDQITALSYYTFRDSASTAVEKRQVPALNVEIDTNGFDISGGFSTLVFEPVYNDQQQAITEDVWQKWEAGDSARWWSSAPINGMSDRNTFLTLAEIKANNPNAVVGKIGINQGGGNAGLIAASDGLTVNTDTYNFEGSVTLANKDQCKNNGWKDSTDPVFKNQGECVSKFSSQNKSQGNPMDQVVNFFRSMF